MNEETMLQHAIQEALCWLPGVEAWRCNTGRTVAGYTRANVPRYVAFGLRDLSGSVVGTPDIIGCVDGLLLAVEVKLPGGKPTPQQQARLEQITKLGGISLVCCSAEQAVAAVKHRQAQLKRDRELLHILDLASAGADAVRDALRRPALRFALQAALNVWCPRGDPGGDGADGETYRLCREALDEAQL